MMPKPILRAITSTLLKQSFSLVVFLILSPEILARDHVGASALLPNNAPFFTQGSLPLRLKSGGGTASVSGSFMFTDECRPPMVSLYGEQWLVLDCEPYRDPVAARLQELLPLLNQSRDVLHAAPLAPGHPERPSDSVGGERHSHTGNGAAKSNRGH